MYLTVCLYRTKRVYIRNGEHDVGGDKGRILRKWLSGLRSTMVNMSQPMPHIALRTHKSGALECLKNVNLKSTQIKNLYLNKESVLE